MKIVLLTRSLNYGGAERQLVTLARGLAGRGHRVEVLVFYGGGPLQPALAAAGIPVRDLAKRRRWDVFGFLVRLARALRAARAEVVHGYLVAPNLLALLARPLVAPARIVWGVRASNMDLRRYDGLARSTFAISRVLSRYADLIVVNSTAGRNFHAAQGFPAESMLTIPNGIDTELFAPDAAAGRARRAAWGIPAGARVVGHVGRLDPMKDHPTFLQAAGRLAARHADLRFVCVGDGPADYRRRLGDLARELGLADRIVWAGTCHDMPAAYNAFDVAVSSSAFGEGFPNVVAEALACGVPAVATDVGDAAEVVGPDGLLVPPGDPKRLADAVGAALDGGAQDAGRLRQRVCDEFSVERLLDRTEAALNDVLRDGSSAAGPARVGARRRGR